MIKEWRRHEYPKELVEIRKLKERLEEMDTLAESRNLNTCEIEEWSKKCKEVVEAEKNNSQDLKQKSCIKWVIDGDKNTSFFHASVNNKIRKNNIHF